MPEITAACQGKDGFGLALLLIVFLKDLFLTTVVALAQQDSYNATSSVAQTDFSRFTFHSESSTLAKIWAMFVTK